MNSSRRAGIPALPLAAVLMALAVTATGCTDEDGPLMLAGYGNVLDGDERPAYFTLEMCTEDDEPADITITDVTAIGLQGTSKPLEFSVAWADGPSYTPTISSHQPLPDAYTEAIGAEGRVGECGKPDDHASLAVLFPPVGRHPILLTDVEMIYEVDGDSYTAAADAFLAQCPAGTEAGTDIDDYQQLCHKSRAHR